MARNSERNTKYRFLIEALKLFSEKGYEAVSVAEIAKAVGCSAPALYKHYKSKQELLEAVIEESNKGFAQQMDINKVDVKNNPEVKKAIMNMTEEEEIERLQGLVRYAVHNEFSQAFRKFCAVEQYHMKELAEIYTYRYITFQYEQAEEIFKVKIDEKMIKEGNPKSLAVMYMSFPIIAVEICDREPDREEEIMEEIANHVREFNRYLKK